MRSSVCKVSSSLTCMSKRVPSSVLKNNSIHFKKKNILSSIIYSLPSHRNYNTITFYNFVSRDVNNNKIDFSNLKGKVSLVAIVNFNHPEYKNFLRELAELKRKEHGLRNCGTVSNGDFELIVLPRSSMVESKRVSLTSDSSPLKQFLSNSTTTSNSTDTSEMTTPSLTILKTILNEEGSYVNNEMFNFLANYGNFKTIVEDFEKFVVDKEGRVVYRSGNDSPLDEVIEVIKKELLKSN
ncbi:hypothetical protein C9374_014339 [Naegleria lovaniensis]|uniref:Uncharacterized protein n=1 Tax=Naegleria lovaniensis TaxID=51637 RepID=A0AA88H0B6_NAELO|nr:uncharacterized protein C9374_014339 [Naegleria lovaniensis]KAG2388939.1 hypothetical protein C9374_014339 [Naegleria lovaniensis]